jgi:hypothetical protein
MAKFISDNKELKTLSNFLELCKTENVKYKISNLTQNLTRIKIENGELHKLSYGVKYSKRGDCKVYYFNDSVILVNTSYGFVGRGEPHKRSTYAKAINGDIMILVDELNNHENYSGRTSREMEKIIKEYSIENMQ